MPPEPSRLSTRYRLSTTVSGATSAKEGLHDPLRDRRGHLAALSSRALDDDRDRDLRVVGGRERDEPRVVRPVTAFRGAGLAGDGDAGDLRPGGGAGGHHALHHRLELI